MPTRLLSEPMSAAAPGFSSSRTSTKFPTLAAFSEALACSLDALPALLHRCFFLYQTSAPADTARCAVREEHGLRACKIPPGSVSRITGLRRRTNTRATEGSREHTGKKERRRKTRSTRACRGLRRPAESRLLSSSDVRTVSIIKGTLESAKDIARHPTHAIMICSRAHTKPHAVFFSCFGVSEKLREEGLRRRATRRDGPRARPRGEPRPSDQRVRARQAHHEQHRDTEHSAIRQMALRSRDTFLESLCETAPVTLQHTTERERAIPLLGRGGGEKGLHLLGLLLLGGWRILFLSYRFEI